MQTLLRNICATEHFNSEPFTSVILANSKENDGVKSTTHCPKSLHIHQMYKEAQMQLFHRSVDTVQKINH